MILYRLGEEFDEETTYGRKFKTTVTMDGNKLITNQKAEKEGEKDVLVVREFTEEGLTMKMTADGVTASQEYKKRFGLCDLPSFCWRYAYFTHKKQEQTKTE